MKVKKIITLLIFSLILTYALSAGAKTFAGETGGKDQTELNVKIDTKDLSGINLWIAEMYNNDRVLYAIVVTLVMAALGSIMAFGTDLVLKYFGMSVGRISHTE
jgi:hypothetical protein